MKYYLLTSTIFLCGVIGCGGSSSTPPSNPNITQPPLTPNVPNSGTQGSTTTSGSDLHQMDPAKHTIPDKPATGSIRGKPFTPDRVEIEGNKLTLRVGKDFFADAELTIFFTNLQSLTNGVQVTVNPKQKWTDGIPSLQVSAKEGDNLPDTKFVNDDYAMTLELGKAAAGKIPGKIYLSLPDSQKSYVVGTFTAKRVRSLSEPPGDDEVPFIQGKISPALKKDQQIFIGYVGLANGEVVSDGAGATPLGEEGTSSGGRSMSFKPRTASIAFEKFVPKYDFSNLPPGRYIVYARSKGAAPSWKSLELSAKDRLTVDLTQEKTPPGSVAVTAPAGVSTVRLVPTNLGLSTPNERFEYQLSVSLELTASIKDGKATIENVPVGKYTVHATDGANQLKAEVDVNSGKSTAVELKATKK